MRGKRAKQPLDAFGELAREVRRGGGGRKPGRKPGSRLVPKATGADLERLLALLPPEVVAEEIAAMPAGYREALAMEAATNSFSEFVRQAWQHIDQQHPLVWGWYMEALCEHLDAVARGWIKNILINIPPGHAKSQLCCVLWPAWLWIRNPGKAIMCASYADDLVTRDSIKCRDLLRSDWYQERFVKPPGAELPRWQLKADMNTQHYFANSVGGHRIATTVGGAGAGLRADVIIIDDPLNIKEAYSKAAREEVLLWYGRTISGRFNDPKTGSQVIIMQRLHEDDLSGFVMRAPGFEHLMLPSEFDGSRRSVTYVRKPLPAVPPDVAKLPPKREEFWRDPRQEDGELLAPERFPREVLDAAKAPNAMGAEGYAGQHLQNPRPEDGGMFKVENWRFWKPDGAREEQTHPRPRGCYAGPARALPELDQVILSVDATFKETASGSFVAIHVWGKSGADRFLLDRCHKRMDFAATCREIKTMCLRHPEADRKIIEDKANGSAIVSQLGRVIPGFIPVEPGGGKQSRAHVSSAYQEAGNLYLPDGAPWLGEFIDEHAVFPRGSTNDDVDAASQAIIALEDEESTAAYLARMSDSAVL